MKPVPFERYLWMAQPFPREAWGQLSFYQLMCQMAEAFIPTNIVSGPNGPIVVTWARQALANA